ncbi:hypothetical protein G9A89_013542 [Geosiphon pyriformis]|nr:hypothetical protein G9A89_013542 [Geosiphon pyriformis]
MEVISVYTNELLKDLGSCKIKCNATAYFSDLNLGIGVRVDELVSLTIAELQTIALALECVPLNSSVIEQCGIINLIKGNQLDVSWYKVKGHLGVISNKCADKLASLAADSDLALPVLVKERFIKADRVAVSENICHFACEIFKSVNHAHWEIGPGFNVIDSSLLDNVNWFHTALV